MEIKRLILSLLLPPAAALSAAGESFTVDSFDFNDGFQGWTPQQGTRLEWVVEQVAPPGDYRSFSNFDPDDISSLFTIVPMSMSGRTHSYIVSPEIYIPEEATLDFYIGFSSYYDFACRMLLEVSTDGFLTSRTLWNSKNESWGDTSWHWRPVNINLADFADQDVKFRFYYTTGKDQNADDRGGYAGDFGIDNFIISAKSSQQPEDPDQPGQAPLARILPPVSWLSFSSGFPLLPPETPLTFTDVSEGSPTLSTWLFTGLEENPLYESTFRGRQATVTYPYTGNYSVKLIPQNEYGADIALMQVSVEYAGDIAKVVFPGDNLQSAEPSTPLVEKFDAPPARIMVSGAWVVFNELKCDNPLDKLMSVGVHMYSERNGTPNIRMASGYLSVDELCRSFSPGTPIYFPFDKPVFIDKDFFITVDGLPPTKPETAVKVAVSGEALLLVPTITYQNFHSPFEQYSFKTDGNNGEFTIELFSTFPVTTQGDIPSWIGFDVPSNGFDRMVTLSYDSLPATISRREGAVTFGDGFNFVTVNIIQDAFSGIISTEEDVEDVEYYTLDGIRVKYPVAGCLYIVRCHGTWRKMIFPQ